MSENPTNTIPSSNCTYCSKRIVIITLPTIKNVVALRHGSFHKRSFIGRHQRQRLFLGIQWWKRASNCSFYFKLCSWTVYKIRFNTFKPVKMRLFKHSIEASLLLLHDLFIYNNHYEWCSCMLLFVDNSSTRELHFIYLFQLKEGNQLLALCMFRSTAKGLQTNQIM